MGWRHTGHRRPLDRAIAGSSWEVSAGNTYLTSLLSSFFSQLSHGALHRPHPVKARGQESVDLVPTVGTWGEEQGENRCRVDPGMQDTQ